MRLSATMLTALREIDRRLRASGQPRIHQNQLTAGRHTVDALRVRGLVERASLCVSLTEAGRDELGRSA